eukprot:6389833-Lingulodinium_polyedra.AAC.1
MPEADENKILEILHQRGQQDHVVDESFWQSEEVMQGFDPGDKELITKYVETVVQDPKKKEFEQDLWQHTKKVHDSTAKKAGKKKALGGEKKRKRLESFFTDCKNVPVEDARM